MVHPQADKAINMFADTVRRNQHTMQSCWLTWEIQELPNPRAPGGYVHVLVPVMAAEMKW